LASETLNAMRRAILLIAVAAGLIGPAHGFDFEPIKPLDVTGVDPGLLANAFGTWEIRDKSGKRRCRIELKKESGIGGYQIDVAADCTKAFPVMGDISAWRLLQNWTIDLVDPLRKTRLRFETPDDRYVALGEASDVAGIDVIVKIQDKSGPRKK
jgi:Protease inhibitor Inh